MNPADFIQAPENQGVEASRDQKIIRTSVIGILANVFLAAFKAAAGLLSHSIAVVLDAVNNLSDAASSVITIVGTKLAAKEPDKKHPFGYGRIEYLSAMIISLIIAAGVAVKLILGRYVKGMGERLHSDSLVNSGEDARLDAVISASTLVAAGIYLLWGVSLEAWLGAVISVIIIKSGVEMLRDTLSKILGERADAELAREIKRTVCSFPDVTGAYDLVLNNYGPDAFNGSVHIEVPDTYSANQLDELIREITLAVYQQHHVILSAIGVYSVNTKDQAVMTARHRIRDCVFSHDHILQMHGFYLNEEKKTIRFDIIISFDAPDRRAVYQQIVQDVQALYPDYRLMIAMDTDFSES